MSSSKSSAIAGARSGRSTRCSSIWPTPSACRCWPPTACCTTTRPRREVLDVFTCARHHTHLDAAGDALAPNGERHLQGARSRCARFSPICPRRIANTAALAERLEFSLENLGYEFPRFPCRRARRMDSFLRAA